MDGEAGAEQRDQVDAEGQATPCFNAGRQKCKLYAIIPVMHMVRILQNWREGRGRWGVVRWRCNGDRGLISSTAGNFCWKHYPATTMRVGRSKHQRLS